MNQFNFHDRKEGYTSNAKVEMKKLTSSINETFAKNRKRKDHERGYIIEDPSSNYW